MEITNTYTCQFCGNSFDSEQEEYIQKGVSPVCSYKCQFNIIYNILKNYSKEDLNFLKEQFHIFCPENKLVFELTKRYLKILSSVSPDCPFIPSGQSE